MAHAAKIGITLCTLLSSPAFAEPVRTSTSAAEGDLYDALVGLAASPATERVRGAERAGRLGHPLLLGPLRSALGASEPEVRAAAAWAIGAIGVPRASSDLQDAIEALSNATADRDDQVAVRAIEALARFPFPEARRRLRSLTRADSVARRAAAHRALAARSGPEAVARFSAYLALVDRESATDAVGLVTTPPPSVRFGLTDPLLLAARGLLDPDVLLHERATRELAELPNQDAAFVFLVRALSEPAPEPRRIAAEALAAREDRRASLALLQSLDDPDLQTRAAAARGVSRQANEEVATRLVARLKSEPDRDLRRNVQRWLEAQPDAAVLDALYAWPAEISEGDRVRAVELASARTSTRAAQVLVRFAAETRRPSTVRSALAHLAARPDGEVVPAVLEELVHSRPNEELRLRMAAALADRTDPRIAPALLGLIEAGRGDNHLLALLAAQPEPAVRPGMLALTASDNSDARRAAFSGIADYRGADVSKAMVVALDKHPTEDRAFALLAAQPRDSTLGVMLELLARERHARRHRAILERLDGARDPRIPDAVVAAAKLDPSLAPDAIRALERQDETAAVEALAELAGAENLDPRARASAVRTLARLDAPDVESRLVPLAGDDSVDVRMAARNALHGLQPQTYPSWDPYGRVPLVTEGAMFGAAMMLMTSDIADANLSPFFTAGVGALLGGATPFLLTLGEDVTLGDAGYFGTVGAWGTLGGWGLGGALGLSGRDTRWMTVAGEAVGLAVGGLTLGAAEWGLDDVALVNVASLEASITSAAIASLLAQRDDDRGRVFYAGLLGGAAATVPMAILSRQLRVKDDLLLLAATMTHGAWLGAFAPGLLRDDMTAGDAFAAAVVGQGLGFFVGLTWAQLADVRTEDVEASWSGAALGSATFGGLALLLDGADRRVRFGLMEAGTLAGAVSMGLAARHLQMHENDSALVALGGLAGAIGGAQLPVRLAEGELDARSVVGTTLLGAGIGTTAGLVLSQLVDVNDRELHRSVLGALVLGAAGSGFGLMAPTLDVRARTRITDAALLAGLLVTAPFADELVLDGPTLAYASVLAGAGGLLGGFGPAWWHADGEPLPGRETGGGMLFGSALGFAGGVAIAQALNPSGGDVTVTAAASLATGAMGAGLGLMVPSFERRTTVGLLQGATLVGLVGASALAGSDSMRSAHDGELGSALAAHASMFALHGAAHGALLPLLTQSEEPSASQVGGGVMLGMGAGTLAGMLAIELFDRPLATDELLEGSALSLAAHGLGAGIGLVADRPRLSFGLMEGLGLAGYGAALAFAPHTDYRDAAPTFFMGAGTVGWLGAWLPSVLFDEPGAARSFGGALAGSSLGVLGAAALVNARDDRDDVEVFTVTAAGSGLGAGLGLLLGPGSGRLTAAILEVGGTLGLGTSLLLSPSTTYDGVDLALAGFLASAGAYHGGFVSGLWDEGDVRRVGGGVLSGASLGLTAGLAISQLADVQGHEVVEMAFLTTAAGAVGQGLSLAVPTLSRPERSAAITVAGGLGLGLAAVLAPLTEYEPTDASLIALMSAAGAWQGAWAPALWTDAPDGRARAGGALFGVGAGALTGTLVSQLTDFEVADQGEAALVSMAGHAVAAGLGGLLKGSARTRAGLIEGVGLPTLALGLSLAPLTRYGAGDYGLIGLGSTLGAWHGLWLPALMAGDGDAIEGGEWGGGTLLGLGAGALAAGVASQLVDLNGKSLVEGGLTWAVFTGLGAGMGLLANLDRRPTIALMESAGLLGLVGGLALTDTFEYRGGDYALIPLGTLLGGTIGLTLPAFIDAEDAGSHRFGGGLLVGASAGTIAAATLAQVTDFEAGEVGEAGTFSAMAHAAGYGLGMLIPGSERRLRLGLMNGIGLAGLGVGLAVAPYTQFDGNTHLDMALLGTVGAFAGGFLPVLWNGADIGDVPGQQPAGGLLLGATLGAATGLVLDQTVGLEGRGRRDVAIGASLGALAGSGLGLTFSTDDRVAIGLMEGLTLGGAIGVGSTLGDFEYDAGDLALGTSYVGYLTWHALGLTLLLEGTDRQAAGVAMSTVGLGALTGMYLSQHIHLEVEDVLMLMAGNVWGTWIGGWGGAILRDNLNSKPEGRRSAGLTLVSTVLGSDLGLTVTGLVVGGLLDVEPTRFAVINLSGLGGMMVGMLTAGFAKGEPLKAGNVIGSLSGLVVGAVVTSFFDFRRTPTWDDLLSREPGQVARVEPFVPPPAVKGAFAVESWFPSAAVVPSPVDGTEQYLFTLQGVFQ